VTCLDCSLYDLPRKLAPSSFDVILLSGVLYHLSDMLVGLLALQHLLKEDGVLLIESNAVECFEHSYANFGRFVAGMWWQPTGAVHQRHV
jgi:2-polyprenyl-3-methyl-5-hydroxy-6-metoxy-1,4-benzoquinol methylase